MDPNVLAAIIAVSVAMLGGFAALWRRRNGNDKERTGEMSVAFWQQRFDIIEEKQDRILLELAGMKAYIGGRSGE